MIRTAPARGVFAWEPLTHAETGDLTGDFTVSRSFVVVAMMRGAAVIAGMPATVFLPWEHLLLKQPALLAELGDSRDRHPRGPLACP